MVSFGMKKAKEKLTLLTQNARPITDPQLRELAREVFERGRCEAQFTKGSEEYRVKLHVPTRTVLEKVLLQIGTPRPELNLDSRTKSKV